MKSCFVIILSFFFMCSAAQKILDLHYKTFFGKEKQFQFFNNQNFTYREKGKIFRTTKRITNMQDSIILFDDESILILGDIKSVKIKGINLSPLLFGAGALFLFLDSFHNVAYGKDYLISRGALIVCGSFLLASGIFKLIQDIHINHKRFLSLQILDLKFDKINNTN